MFTLRNQDNHKNIDTIVIVSLVSPEKGGYYIATQIASLETCETLAAFGRKYEGNAAAFFLELWDMLDRYTPTSASRFVLASNWIAGRMREHAEQYGFIPVFLTDEEIDELLDIGDLGDYLYVGCLADKLKEIGVVA